MANSNTISVFEYGYLAVGEKAHTIGATRVDTGTFNYLEQLSLERLRLEQREGGIVLKLIFPKGVKALQVQNYVGVICTPEGIQIEVLPKIARKQNCEESRMAFLAMLRHLRQFRHIEFGDANISTGKVPLLEIYIRQFLHSVNTLIKRGLRSEYVRQEDNLAFMKGKLLAGKQLRHNLVNKHKFYVEYDEYLQDRPANRLIKTALLKISKIARSANSQKLLRELSFVFDEIPKSRCVKSDFSALRLDRGMAHYQAPLAWAKLILQNESPLAMQGQANALSLLFPMEAIFESYVASLLARQIPPEVTLKSQASSVSLVSHNEQGFFRLKPDLLIQNKATKANVAVLDTKWKLIEPSLANSRDKYGLSQTDFYQMFAYGHKYLRGSGELYLIYPAHDDFQQPIQHSFDFADELKLWVVPFKICPKGNSQILWPEGSSLLGEKRQQAFA